MGNASATKPVIGLVGGVGAGKSTVAAAFARLGCLVIDADSIGHEVMEMPGVRNQLRKLWGNGILDAQGKVDRARVAEVVFADPAQLARLNVVVHPLIAERIVQAIKSAQGDPLVRAAVLDAAVVLEAGWDKFCTHLVYVHAADEARAARVACRGWDRQRWEACEKMQISLDKKRKRCDYYIDNSSSVSHLGEQIRELFGRILMRGGTGV